MNNTPTPTVGSHLSLCNTFPSFPKLPNEIQDMIWDLSMPAQAIEFRYMNPKDQCSRHGWFTANKLRKSTKDHAIFRICRASQARALRWRAENTYNLTALRFVSPGQGGYSEQPPSFSFDYDPAVDTIYAPDFYEFLEIRYNVELAGKSHETPQRSYANIRSLALGGIFQKATYWFHNDDLREAGCLVINSFIRMCYQSLSRVLAPFHELEELVFVVPPISELTKSCTGRELLHSSSFKYAIQPDPSIIVQNIKQFKEKVEGFLLAQEHLPFPNADPLMNRQGSYSNWWSNPTVTLMTEEELFARCGAEEKHGISNLLKIRENYAKSSACRFMFRGEQEPHWMSLILYGEQYEASTAEGVRDCRADHYRQLSAVVGP